MFLTHYINGERGVILWQRDHYNYEIENRNQGTKTNLTDTPFEIALEQYRDEVQKETFNPRG